MALATVRNHLYRARDRAGLSTVGLVAAGVWEGWIVAPGVLDGVAVCSPGCDVRPRTAALLAAHRACCGRFQSYAESTLTGGRGLVGAQ